MFSRQSFKILKSIGKPRIHSAVCSQKYSQTNTNTKSFQEWRKASTDNSIKMASSSKILLGADDIGVVKYKPQDAETAARTSELLQENHNKHHIFFNESGYHNHIVHHLLTLYSLGAPVDIIEKQYKLNASYQRPQLAVEERILEDMSNPESFKKYLAKEKYYQDFLVYFQQEIEKKGWENVLNEYLFAEDERADDLLGRLYAGFLHPLIHLGFGIEFHQPAIIAEALAQAAVHDAWTRDFLLKAEQAAKSAPTGTKTLPDLIDEINANTKLSTAADWDDGNKIRDGILVRAPDEMLKYTSQWKVDESNLEEKTAEMIHNTVYFTAAAQRPPKQVKFDFYFIHCLNSSIFFPTFNTQTWLSPRSKVRLLQWKAYIDLTMYASRRSPKLHIEEIALYVPKLLEAGDAEWKGIFTRLFEFEDDGHAIKVARAVANAQNVCESWEEKEKEGKGGDWLRVKAFMWEKVGNMAVDSVEDSGDTWVRSSGFEQAWEGIGDRPRKDVLEVRS